jgi:hypothetical protein
VHWHEQRIRLAPPIGAPEAEAIFTFINRGAEPVRVVELHTGCGCTGAVLEKDEVPPGEEGRIRTTFHAGDRRGLQTVAVTVVTEGAERTTHNLVLEVDVKEAATLTPRLVFWRQGDPPTAKTVQVRLAPGFRIQRVAGNADFAVEVQTSGDGEASLQIVPRTTADKRIGPIHLWVEDEAGTTAHLNMVARVL